MRLEQLTDVGLERGLGHAVLLVRVQRLLRQEEAVGAIDVAGRSARLGQQVEPGRSVGGHRSLHEAQQNREEGERADEDEHDRGREERGVLPLRPHARDRRETSAPQVADRPLVLPEREDRGRHAAGDEPEPQVPRGIRKANVPGPGKVVEPLEELHDREAESDERHGRSQVRHHRALEGKPGAHPGKMAVGRHADLEPIGRSLALWFTHGPPCLLLGSTAATSASASTFTRQRW